MRAMAVLADEKRVDELIDSLAGAITEEMSRNQGKGGDDGAAGEDKWALVGIKSRGDVLARRLAERLDAGAIEGRVGSLDITLYRDDLSEVGPGPVVRTTEIPFSFDKLNVVLVDDVLMTGRSVRAAMALLVDMGRAKRIWLSVLVDRGGREVPIAADHVGLDLKNGSVGERDRVNVRLRPTDSVDAIEIESVSVSGVTQEGAR